MGDRSRLGIGRPISQEQAGRLSSVMVEFPDFSTGVDLRDAEQDQETGVTQESADFVVTNRNRLRRAPGHSIVEMMSGRTVKAMHVHTSLDFDVELLMFDGAFLGVKSTGATTWYNASLPNGDNWVGTPNLDKFLFSNGANGIYQRNFGGAGTVALISNSPPCKTLANFAGRVFAGGVTLGATYQALGVSWSADAEGLVWTGLGSGATLLIPNANTDDRLIALRPVGFDLLVALCQKSIWVGRQTGDRYEPATFEPRVQGLGCIAEPTVQQTPIGTIFLSESGVNVFDGNQAQMISGPINSELLPLLTNVLSSYSSSYEQVSARYKLYTPTCTWVYELRNNRWLKFRYVAHRAVAFSEQFSGVTWNNVLSIWSASTDTWSGLTAPLGQERVVLTDKAKLATESQSSNTYIDGTTVKAQYGFLRRDTSAVNSLFETQRLMLRKLGGESALEIWLPDHAGDFVLRATKNVSNTATERGIEMGLRATGRGTGAQIRWTSSDFELSKAQIVGLLRSRALGVL